MASDYHHVKSTLRPISTHQIHADQPSAMNWCSDKSEHLCFFSIAQSNNKFKQNL